LRERSPLVPVLLPVETVRRTVVSELSARLGMPVTIRGDIAVAVIPQLSIRLNDVRFGEGDAGTANRRPAPTRWWARCACSRCCSAASRCRTTR
jgi:hypothetical protein